MIRCALWVTLLLSSALAGPLMLGGCGPSKKDKEQSELKASADVAYQRLARIREELAAPAPACAESKPEAAAVHLITRGQLERTVGQVSGDMRHDPLTHEALRLPPRDRFDVENPRSARTLRRLWPEVSRIAVLTAGESATVANPSAQLRVFALDGEHAGLPCELDVAVDPEGLAKAGYRDPGKGVIVEGDSAMALRTTLCQGVAKKITETFAEASVPFELAVLRCD